MFSDKSNTAIQYTCINCQVVFKDVETHRSHYKTDWHRYNLKRKIAEFPPVTVEEFQRRIALLNKENENKSKGKQYTYCTICKKSFASDKSFENHLQSKKHVDLLHVKNVNSQTNVTQPSIKNIQINKISAGNLTEKFSDTESIETVSSGTAELDSDEWEEIVSENNPILNYDCLFCTHHSASLTKNVKHMSVAHSFFIPHIEYLIDLQGLLLYLGEKICQGLTCIWCNDRKSSFMNIEAVRNHMIDKGHTKIATDTESSLEYLDFYDFNVAGNNEDDDVKSVNGTNNTDLNECCAEKNDYVDNTDATTMLLPSGETIYHRSLVKYFRQNPIIVNKKQYNVKKNKIEKLIYYYRSLGWNPTKKETIKKKVKDIKYITFIQSKYELKLRVNANKLQPHFRPQVDF